MLVICLANAKHFLMRGQMTAEQARDYSRDCLHIVALTETTNAKYSLNGQFPVGLMFLFSCVYWIVLPLNNCSLWQRERERERERERKGERNIERRKDRNRGREKKES